MNMSFIPYEIKKVSSTKDNGENYVKGQNSPGRHLLRIIIYYRDSEIHNHPQPVRFRVCWVINNFMSLRSVHTIQFFHPIILQSIF